MRKHAFYWFHLPKSLKNAVISCRWITRVEHLAILAQHLSSGRCLTPGDPWWLLPLLGRIPRLIWTQCVDILGCTRAAVEERVWQLFLCFISADRLQ